MSRAFYLTDLIDLKALRELVESLWLSSGLPTKLIDSSGRVLASAGSQDLCFLFHRQHPVTLRRCIESDTELEELLGARTEAGPPLESRCRNGLNHIGFPIIVAGQHLATLFLSQFFYEPPDEAVFLQRARELGLEENTYLAALRKVPILDRARVREAVPFYDVLVRLLTEMGEREARLLESQEQLRMSEEKFRSIIESTPLGVHLYQLDADDRLIFSGFNPAAEAILGVTLADHLGKPAEEIFPPLATMDLPEHYRAVCRGERWESSEIPYNYGDISGIYEIHAFPAGARRMAVLFADISERKRQEEELRYRERLESLVAHISTRLMEKGATELAAALDLTLSDIGEFAGVDRCYLFQLAEDGETMANTNEWCAAGVSGEKSRLQAVLLAEIPWLMTRILAGEVVHIPRVAELPPEAQREREHLAAQAIRSLLAVPVATADRIVGLLGFDAVHREKRWDERDTLLLRTVGEIIGSALERRRAEEALEYRATLEKLIAEISARMVNLEAEAVDEAIGAALCEIGTFVRVDRCYVFEFSPDGRVMDNTHEWCDAEIQPFKKELRALPIESLPWFGERIGRREPVYVPDVATLPPEAAAEKAEWSREGIRSLLCMPMALENRLLGFIGFDAVRQSKRWPEEIILLLRVVGECFANALERRRNDRVRRERERALRKSRERIALAQRLALTGTWEWEIATNKVVWSQETFDLVHMDRRRFDGTLVPFWQMIHPEDLPAVEKGIADCLERGIPFRMDYRVRGDDGRIYWLASAGDAIRNAEGMPTGMGGLIQDITERKQAETALHTLLQETEEARTRMSAILRCLPAGVLLTDPEERIVLANAPAQAMLQLSPEAGLPGQSAAMPLVPLLSEQIRGVLRGVPPAGPAEWEITDDRGERCTIQARTDPVLDSAGRITGAITLVQDITSEREVDRLKSEFISTAAHELRTPLASVIGYSELLLNQAQFGTFSAEEQRGFLEEINARAEDLAEIVDDLLNLSRVESGQIVRLRPVFSNLEEVLRDAVADFVRLHPEYRFDLQLAEDLPGILIDAGKLRQVLDNLLGNASKFSPAGTTITVEGEQVGAAVEIRVRDEGIGMTPEQVRHVFDKFYRGDASNTAVGGLGLGMTIVKNIVEAHAGSIRVESARGHGTIVRFTLPLAALLLPP